jgi:hypothetical protein
VSGVGADRDITGAGGENRGLESMAGDDDGRDGIPGNVDDKRDCNSEVKAENFNSFELERE